MQVLTTTLLPLPHRYSNVPDSLGGPGVCGGGSYREIEVRSPLIALDDARGGTDVRGGNLLPRDLREITVRYTRDHREITARSGALPDGL
jgi:hypothetical protein